MLKLYQFERGMGNPEFGAFLLHRIKSIYYPELQSFILISHCTATYHDSRISIYTVARCNRYCSADAEYENSSNRKIGCALIE